MAVLLDRKGRAAKLRARRQKEGCGRDEKQGARS
jgi:hypothetical protein